MALEQFIESLEQVPPEFERNYLLIRQLDIKTKDAFKQINEATRQYKQTSKTSERTAIRQNVNNLFDRILSYAEDKIDLARQTYALVDENITQLNPLGTIKAEGDLSSQATQVDFDMPVNPDEPRYCKCRGVSYGEMVCCDNKDCKIEWFHFGCVGLSEEPRGKWYCEYCAPLKTPLKVPKKRKH